MNARLWKYAVVLLACAAGLAAATLAMGQDDTEKEELIAVLGKVRDLNEKDPQLVRAEFKNADDVVIEEEKLYVRWERLHKDEGRWIVLSAFCPHSKCKVIFDATQRIFQDPCYGSEYDLTGRVKKGPSKKPLPDYSQLAYEEDGLLKLRRIPDE